MKRFFLNILICIAILTVINVLYIFIIDGRFRSYTEKYLAFPQKNIKTLILGDSHSNSSWKWDTTRTLYNFSFGSDNIIDYRRKYDFAKRYWKGNGRTLILSFDPHLLTGYRMQMNNNDLTGLLNGSTDRMRYLNMIPIIVDDNIAIDVAAYYTMLTKGKAKSDNSLNSDQIDSVGFQRRFSTQLTKGKEAGLNKQLLTEYQSLISDAKREHITIIGVKYPVHPYYNQLIKQNAKTVALESTMDSLAEVNNIPLLDFSGSIKNSEYFFNQDHVNKIGAAVFMKAFKENYSPNLKGKKVIVIEKNK